MKKYKCLHCGEIIEDNDMHKGVRYYCNLQCRALRKLEVNRKQAYVRFQINNRDHFACAFCGRTSYRDRAKLTLKNVSSVVSASIDNMITCCTACNRSMLFTGIDHSIISEIRDIIKLRNAELEHIDSIREAISYIRHDEKMRKKQESQ